MSTSPEQTAVMCNVQLAGGLAVLEFLGLILGKALYEGLLMDLPLAPFFITKLQARTAPNILQATC